MPIKEPLTMEWAEIEKLANEARQIMTLHLNSEVIPLNTAKQLCKDIAQRIEDLISEK